MFAWLCSGSHTRFSLTMAHTFLDVWHCLAGLFWCPKTPPSLSPDGLQVKAWLHCNKMMARIRNTTSSRTISFGIVLSTDTLWHCVKIELKRIMQFGPGILNRDYFSTLERLCNDGDKAIKKAAKGDEFAWLRVGYSSGSSTDSNRSLDGADPDIYTPRSWYLGYNDCLPSVAMAVPPPPQEVPEWQVQGVPAPFTPLGPDGNPPPPDPDFGDSGPTPPHDANYEWEDSDA
jgi:hypothetical protein